MKYLSTSIITLLCFVWAICCISPVLILIIDGFLYVFDMNTFINWNSLKVIIVSVMSLGGLFAINKVLEASEDAAYKAWQMNGFPRMDHYDNYSIH